MDIAPLTLFPPAFPVALDDSIFQTWNHELKPNVLKKVVKNAIGWDKDHAKYQAVLKKLVHDLTP